MAPWLADGLRCLFSGSSQSHGEKSQYLASEPEQRAKASNPIDPAAALGEAATQNQSDGEVGTL